MIVSLDDHEVREVLAEALTKKTGYCIGTLTPDDCFFTVIGPDGEIDGVEEVRFSGRA